MSELSALQNSLLHQPSPLRKRLSVIGRCPPGAQTRFQQRLERLPSLRHQNIEAVHEVHFDPPRDCYLLCERVEGDSLADIFDRERRLPLEVVRAITRQTASALTAAHELGLTHGNLSPAAIVLQRPASADAEVWVKVRDFGLGKQLGPELFGALGYLAPEQVDPKEPRPEPTPLSDQFALAVIAFELLAGRRAFIGDSLDEIIPKLREDPVHFQIQGVSKKESERIVSGLHKAMSRQPSGRFASLGDFVAALEARAQNPRSRASVLEASRFAPEHQPPLQLGSSVAQALVVAAKRLPGPLDQARPGQDAQTLTLVRTANPSGAQAATIPMMSRLELQGNVQTTIANQNDSHVNVILPTPAGPTPAVQLRLRARRILLGLLLGLLLSAGLAWAATKLNAEQRQSISRVDQQSFSQSVTGTANALTATGPADETTSQTSSSDSTVHKSKQATKAAAHPKRRKFTFACLPDSKLAQAFSKHLSGCSATLEEKDRGTSLVLPYRLSPDGHPMLHSDLPPWGPAPLQRCQREFFMNSSKSVFGPLPKAGGVLRCMIN